MTWFGQVRHVMWKDLRQARWIMLAYIATVMVATAHAVGWLAPSSEVFQVAMLLVVGVGMFVAATFIQADSPTRTDAFWASRPLQPSAVFAAKVFLTAVVVLVPPLVGQRMAISALDLKNLDAVRIVGVSGYMLAVWLIVGMMAAALTRDIRSLVVTLVATALLLAFGIAVLPDVPSLSNAQRAIFAILGSAGALLLVAALYRTRDNGRMAWVAGFLLAACSTYSLIGGGESLPLEERVPAVRGPGRASLKVVGFERDTLGRRNQLVLSVRAEGASADERLTFMPQGAKVVARNGSIVHVRINSMTSVLVSPNVPPRRSVAWPSSGGGVAPGKIFQVDVPLSAAALRSVASGISRVELDGRFSSVTAQLIGTLPLEQGALVSHDGVRVQIVNVVSSRRNVTFTVRESSAPTYGQSAPATAYFGEGQLELVLMNDSRGEARQLFKLAASSQSGSMVLPGTNIHDESSSFSTRAQSDGSVAMMAIIDGELTQPEPRDVDTTSVAPDAAWLRGARLVIVRWASRGWYPVRAAVSLP